MTNPPAAAGPVPGEALDPALLRPFWYPVLPLPQLQERPVAVELLGEALVLWRDGAGSVHAAPDRCPHRSARLSGGSLTPEGHLACPYHGWSFDGDGHCRSIPQQPDRPIPASCRLPLLPARESCGYVWVCLAAEPRLPPPVFPEEHDPGHRLIPGFWETWRCSPFRLIENGLDNYHHFFVHRGLLEATTPVPDPIEGGLEELPDGLRFSIPLQVHNNAVLTSTLGADAGTLTVERTVRWIAPLGLSLELAWPNGLRQRIVLYAVPRNEKETQVSRFYFRNDREEEVPAAAMVRFERGLIDQDRAILTAMEGGLRPWPPGEHLIEADRPIARLRTRLLELLQPT
ncbi:MAG: Rieske 2Fe-2S domain-containing protein [Synechococcus sp.]